MAVRSPRARATRALRTTTPAYNDTGHRSAVAYSTSPETFDVLARELDEFEVLDTRVEPDVAAAIAGLLAATQLKISDLSKVAEPLRSELTRSGGFAVSRPNLETASSAPTKVGLDTLGGLHDGIGRYLIADFENYVAALREVPKATVVDDPSQLDTVVRAIMEDDAEQLVVALTLLPDGAAYVNHR